MADWDRERERPLSRLIVRQVSQKYVYKYFYCYTFRYIFGGTRHPPLCGTLSCCTIWGCCSSAHHGNSSLVLAAFTVIAQYCIIVIFSCSQGGRTFFSEELQCSPASRVLVVIVFTLINTSGLPKKGLTRRLSTSERK